MALKFAIVTSSFLTSLCPAFRLPLRPLYASDSPTEQQMEYAHALKQ